MGTGKSHRERFGLVCRSARRSNGRAAVPKRTERTANKRALVPYDPSMKGGSSNNRSRSIVVVWTCNVTRLATNAKKILGLEHVECTSTNYPFS